MKHLIQILEKNKNGLSIGFIVLFFYVISHGIWFKPTAILTAWDWFYQWPTVLSTVAMRALNMWASDFWSTFGGVAIDIWMRFPLYLLWVITKYFHIEYPIAQRIIWFYPMILFAIVWSYRLFNFLFKWNFASILSATLLFNFNVYFLILQMSWHMTLAVAYSLAPFVLLQILIFCKSQTHKNLIQWVLILFALSLFEPRVAYVLCWMILIALLFYRVHFWKIFMFYLIFGWLTAFSLVPVLFGWLYWNNSIVKQEVFWDIYMNIVNTLTMFHSFWSWGELIFFSLNKPSVYFYLIPFLFIVTLIYFPKSLRLNKSFFLFVIYVLIWIFLTKQSDHPFPSFYRWAYENIPIFDLYRESSKFYIIVIFWYSAVIWYFIAFLSNKKKILSYAITLMIVIYSLSILSPLILGKEDKMFKERSIPEEYTLINSTIQNDANYWRVLVIPTITRWLDYSNLHPQVSLWKLFREEWKNLYPKGVTYNWENIWLPMLEDYSKLLYESWIAYILLRSNVWESINEWNSYGDYFSGLLSEFTEQTDFAYSMTSTTNLVLYRIIYDKPLQKIEIPNLGYTYREFNESYYTIEINNIAKVTDFILKNSYHNWWKLYIEPYNEISCATLDTSTNRNDVTQCKIDNQFYVWDELLKLRNKPIFENTHKMVYNYANQWTIDSEYIKENYPKEYYRENLDGTIDIRVTLFFRPQAYFYVWFIISSLILLACTLYLTSCAIRTRNRIASFNSLDNE